MNQQLWNEIERAVRYGYEGRKVELKREFPLGDKEKRARFAKFLTAIANAPGGKGYFIIGVLDAKDRRDLSLDESIAGVTYEEGTDADRYGRLIQQALDEFTNPVPSVQYEEVSVPTLSRTVGVVVIERSLSRPHEITRESGSVRPGIYIKRGAEIFVADRADLLEMTGTGGQRAIVINFAHPLNQAQRRQIEEAAAVDIAEVVQPPTLPLQFDEDQSFEEQVKKIVDSIHLTREEWQELHLLVSLPGFAPIAAALVAELHGRMGHFPSVLRFRRVDQGAANYACAEVILLQRIRDTARAQP